MNVLLLEHPRTITFDRANDIANTPLSSCLLSGYAAAVCIQKGHGVEIVEGYLDGLTYDDIWERVAAARPGMLGVHMVYHWQKDRSLFSFLERVKSELGPHIVAYGFYPTIAYADILANCKAIDSVIIGEPESTIALLADASLKDGQLSQIPGLAARAPAGGLAITEPDVCGDLDTLPFPVRTPALLRLSEVNILGSRGCYGRCTFCYINTFFNRGGHGPFGRWRKRSPENVIEEIDEVIARTGLKRFYFADPNFFGPGETGQERARRIARLLKERHVLFGLEGRVNDIHDETIGPLVEAGLRHMLIGLESGRDESLQRMNKMTTVAQNERAVRILRKNGIEPNVGFIMFEPDSSLFDVRTNLEFLRRNNLLGNLAITANVLYHHQILLQGTPAFRALEKEGRLVRAADSSYEGTTYFRDANVALLAGVMRRVTNSLFSSMDQIWSGRIAEPQDAAIAYAQLNSLLLSVFEEGLSSLEKGKRLSEDDASAMAEQATKQIEAITRALLEAGSNAGPSK